MAKQINTTIGGTVKKVSQPYTWVGGVLKKIKKGVCGVGGVVKEFFNGEFVLYDSNGGGNGTTVTSKSSYKLIDFPSAIDFSKYSKMYIDLTSNQTKASSYFPNISAYDSGQDWVFDVSDRTLGTLTENKRYTVTFDISNKSGQIKYCYFYSTSGSGMNAWSNTIHKIWLE